MKKARLDCMPIEDRNNVEDIYTEQGITVSVTISMYHWRLSQERLVVSLVRMLEQKIWQVMHDHEQASVVQGTDRESMSEMSMH